MTEPTGYKRLYRSKKDRVIGGVCGGLGGYLNVDPVILRIIWLAATLIGGAGILAYLIAWILTPEAPHQHDPGPVQRETDGVKVLGIILIVVSLFWLSTRFFGETFIWIPWGWVGPVALVAIGVALLLRPALQRANESSDREVQPEVVNQTEEPATEENENADDKTNPEKESHDSYDGPRLRRSRRDRVLLGVCGGLAKMWNIDATVIRVLWALGTVLGAGVLLIAYLVMALVIPDEEEL